MEFWHTTAWLPPTAMAPVAQACDEHGFGGMLLSDHVLFPTELSSKYPYQPDGQPGWRPESPWIDPWVAIGAMASVTRRVRFSQNIYVFPLRHPVEVAKLAASAAALSDGRVTLGAGVGWMAEEFDILGEQFRTRGARTDEGIEVCRKLWTGEPVAHDGEHYQFPEVRMSPAPPGGSIPVWIGGHSDPALRRAARNDGWIGNAYPLDEADEVLTRLGAALKANGRELGDGFEVVMGIYSMDLDDFRRFADRGVTGFLAAPGMLRGDADGTTGPDVERRIEAIARFADTVVAPLTA
jgi:probable F420-dependent oxidoreductase